MSSGYTHCACRDCFDVTVSSNTSNPELCSLCEEAGCTPPEGMSGYSRECQRDDAYGTFDETGV